MRILYCKTFGIGNAVMAVPAIKALKSLGHSVDVLVGSTPDDFGAFEMFGDLEHRGTIGKIHRDKTDDTEYDLAILAIPYDGRWINGIHFRAKETMDGRTRPDPSTTGLVSWKKHEVEYQMDNVRELGYSGPTPDCSFYEGDNYTWYPQSDETRFYLGLGYKKDAAGFWAKKHWGNDKYSELVKRILERDPQNVVFVTGDQKDMVMSFAPIFRALPSDLTDRFRWLGSDLNYAIDLVSGCHTYIGNDTGMMHVAAAADCPRLVALFFLENSVTKSHPWCENYTLVEAASAEMLDVDTVERTIFNG